MDTDTLIQIQAEDRAQLREQKRVILSKKISPAKKQALWNAVFNPVYKASVIPW